jgi:hypothetical protein
VTVSPPLALLAEITHRCPMRCVYCSNPLALEPASRELDTATWCRVFDEAGDLGILQVHFSGGGWRAARPRRHHRRRRSAGLSPPHHLRGGHHRADLGALAEAGLDHADPIQDSEASADHIGARRRVARKCARRRGRGRSRRSP